MDFDYEDPSRHSMAMDVEFHLIWRAITHHQSVSNAFTWRDCTFHRTFLVSTSDFAQGRHHAPSKLEIRTRDFRFFSVLNLKTNLTHNPNPSAFT